MLLMVEKGMRGGICLAIDRFSKAHIKYMKDYDKNKESSYLNFQDVNNLYGWAMSQKLPIGSFIWVEDIFQFSKDFIENPMEDSNIGYVCEIDVQYPK